MNAQMLYTCTTTLTGIKNREENKFYSWDIYQKI